MKGSQNMRKEIRTQNREGMIKGKGKEEEKKKEEAEKKKKEKVKKKKKENNKKDREKRKQRPSKTDSLISLSTCFPILLFAFMFCILFIVLGILDFLESSLSWAVFFQFVFICL